MASMPTDSPLVCSYCQAPVEGPDLDFRFRLPDPIFDLPEPERAERMHGGGDVVGARGIGVFIRVLLPVVLAGGYRITYGTWLRLLSKADFERVRALWHAADYPSLALDGVLGNAIEPWGRPLMTRARVAVRDVDSVPYVERIYDEQMAKVLTEPWPRSLVLSAIPEAAWHGHAH
jgi:hypothetical protein